MDGPQFAVRAHSRSYPRTPGRFTRGGGVLWLELLIILVRHIIRLLLPGTRYLVYDYQEPGTRTYTKAMGNAGLERHGRSCGRAAISSAVIPGTHYLVKFWGTS